MLRSKIKKLAALGPILLLLFFLAAPPDAEAVHFTLPDDASAQAGATVEIPINSDDLTGEGILSLQITITYNQNILTATDVTETGTILEPWGDVTFHSFPGRVNLAASGAEPLFGSGILAKIVFAVSPDANEGWSTNLSFSDVLLNEGDPQATTEDGRFVVAHTPRITISPDGGELAVGEALGFNVTGDVTPPLSWGTTDGLVATIDSMGQLTAVGAGDCRVVAQDSLGLVDTTGVISVRPFTITVPDTSIMEGRTFDLPIRVTDVSGAGICSWQFALSYRTNILTAIDVIEEGTLSEGWGDAVYSVTEGEIKVSLSATQALSGEGILVYIRFQVTPEGSGGSSLTLLEVIFNEGIRAKIYNGYFTLIQAPVFTVTPNTAVLTVGDSLQFSVTGPATPPYSWSTTDSSIATIDENGLLRAVEAGICSVIVVDSLDISASSGPIVINKVAVSAPDTTGPQGGIISLPIRVEDDVTGLEIWSLEMTLSFNGNILRADSVIIDGALMEGWTLFFNPSEDQITVTAAGTSPLSGEGPLLFIEFQVDSNANVGANSPLELDSFLFNEGVPSATRIDGLLRVGPPEGVEEEPEGLIPYSFRLRQNYPNPFNSTTLIHYQLSAVRGRPSAVILKVYNLLGQEVKTLVEREQAPGYYTVRWDGRDGLGEEVTSGIYFCRLQAGGFVETKRMVLLK